VSVRIGDDGRCIVVQMERDGLLGWIIQIVDARDRVLMGVASKDAKLDVMGIAASNKGSCVTSRRIVQGATSRLISVQCKVDP